MSEKNEALLRAKFIGNKQISHNLYEHVFLAGSGKKFLAGQYQSIISAQQKKFGPFSILSTPDQLPTIRFLSRTKLEITEGEFCTLTPPVGNMTIQQSELSSSSKHKQKFIFIAGGTGIAPFISLAQNHPDHDIEIYWSIKSRSDEILIETCLSEFPEEKLKKHLYNDENLLEFFSDIPINKEAIYYLAGPYPLVDKLGQFLLEKNLTQLISDMKKLS